MGVDLSLGAVEHARRADPAGAAEYRQLNLTDAAGVAELAAGPGGPPAKLRRVFDHGLRPADAADKEVPEVLAEAGLEILAEGPTALAQTEQWPDGSRVELPARWFVVSRA